MIGHKTDVVGKVLIITLDRPDFANSLDEQTCHSLDETFTRFERSFDQRVCVVTGKGDKFFCSGLDLNMLKQGTSVSLPASGFGGLTNRQMTKPVIAAVNGFALGGGFELALACDILISDEAAKFGLPEPRVGQAALAGGLIRLPLAIGQKRALDLILTGRMISAGQAEHWGLVNEVTKDGGCLDRALEVAECVADNAPLAIAVSKYFARIHESAPQIISLTSNPPEIVQAMRNSADAEEGVRAFFEKRKPNWIGK